MKSLIQKLKCTIIQKPNLDGKWLDLNCITTGKFLYYKRSPRSFPVFLFLHSTFNTVLEKDLQNETNVDDFLREASEEDEAILKIIKSSFYCWKQKKKSKPVLQKIIKIIKSDVANLFCLYVITVAIGFVLGNAKNLSLLFVTDNQ